MKISYRGHEIEVKRDRAMGGWMSLYYSVFRESDGYECTSGFSCEDQTPVRDFVRLLKERVDAELAEADPWGEKQDNVINFPARHQNCDCMACRPWTY